MDWKHLDEDQKKSCYESYISDVRYEHGDNAKILSFAEYCRECEEFGEALL